MPTATTMRTIVVKVPDEDREAIERLAASSNQTVSQFVRAALKVAIMPRKRKLSSIIVRLSDEDHANLMALTELWACNISDAVRRSTSEALERTNRRQPTHRTTTPTPNSHPS